MVKLMVNKDLDAPSDFEILQVDCPACPGRFDLAELIPIERVHCPGCGKDWRVRPQDVPGRALVDLLPIGD